MDITFYDLKGEFITGHHNCTIKPNTGDYTVINNELYEVKKITFDYSKNTIHIIVKNM